MLALVNVLWVKLYQMSLRALMCIATVEVLFKLLVHTKKHKHTKKKRGSYKCGPETVPPGICRSTLNKFLNGIVNMSYT